MSEDALVYVEPAGESQILEGTAASAEPEICVMPLKDNGDQERILYQPGTSVVYDPMIAGDYIIFLDNYGDQKAG